MPYEILDKLPGEEINPVPPIETSPIFERKTRINKGAAKRISEREKRIEEREANYVEPTGLSKVGQTAAQIATTGVASALGVPHSLENLAQYIGTGIRGVFGMEQPSEKELQAAQSFLSSEKIKKEMIEPAIGKKYLEPTNTVQELANTFADYLGGQLFPIPGIKGASLARKAVASGIGASLKIGAKKMNFSPIVQEVAGLSGVMAASMLGPIAETAASQFLNSGKKIAETVDIGVPKLTEHLDNLEKMLGESVGPDRKVLQEIIDLVRGVVQPFKGKVNAAKLWNMKEQLNAWYQNGKLSSQGQHAVSEMVKSIYEDIGTAAKDVEPGLGDLLKGNEIYRAVKQSTPFIEWLDKNINLQRMGSNLLNTILGRSSVANLPMALVGGGAALVAKPVIKSIATAVKSPTLMKLYGELGNAAAANNVNAANKIIKQMNDYLNKEYPEEVAEFNKAQKQELQQGKYEILDRI
jgi:hypothetical protein